MKGRSTTFYLSQKSPEIDVFFLRKKWVFWRKGTIHGNSFGIRFGPGHVSGFIESIALGSSEPPPFPPRNILPKADVQWPRRMAKPIDLTKRFFVHGSSWIDQKCLVWAQLISLSNADHFRSAHLFEDSSSATAFM